MTNTKNATFAKFAEEQQKKQDEMRRAVREEKLVSAEEVRSVNEAYVKDWKMTELGETSISDVAENETEEQKEEKPEENVSAAGSEPEENKEAAPKETKKEKPARKSRKQVTGDDDEVKENITLHLTKREIMDLKILAIEKGFKNPGSLVRHWLHAAKK